MDTDGSFSAGEIRQTKNGSELLLEFNADADPDPEMSIVITHSRILGSSDFVL